MIASRLRECLKILRWDTDDLADELARPQGEVAAWLDGRSFPALPVAAWIEALVKAHKSMPAPGRNVPFPGTNTDTGSAEIRLRPAVVSHAASPGLAAHPLTATRSNRQDRKGACNCSLTAKWRYGPWVTCTLMSL
jgi:hypothetical protein